VGEGIERQKEKESLWIIARLRRASLTSPDESSLLTKCYCTLSVDHFQNTFICCPISVEKLWQEPNKILNLFTFDEHKYLRHQRSNVIIERSGHSNLNNSPSQLFYYTPFPASQIVVHHQLTANTSSSIFPLNHDFGQD